MLKKIFCLAAVLVITGTANAVLMAHYNFGVATPSTANRGSLGTVADGILENSATIVDIDPDSRGVEWALKLDANAGHQRMNISNGTDWFTPLVPNGHPFTISAWVQLSTSAISSWNFIASKGYESTWHLATGTPQGNGPDQIAYAVHKGVASWSPLNGTVSVMHDDLWYHVVGTINEANYKIAKLYINGVLQDSLASWNPCYTNTEDILVGDDPIKAAQGYDYSWTGYIDDVRIYDYALNDTEVHELFTTTYNPARPTIPEPTITTLLGIGGLALLRRRR
ncbi:MAG: LamG domain-containing protein [Planctomycetota bacterium]|jgi:hypothetical protein